LFKKKDCRQEKLKRAEDLVCGGGGGKRNLYILIA
jgi:hypothetical protein